VRLLLGLFFIISRNARNKIATENVAMCVIDRNERRIPHHTHDDRQHVSLHAKMSAAPCRTELFVTTEVVIRQAVHIDRTYWLYARLDAIAERRTDRGVGLPREDAIGVSMF